MINIIWQILKSKEIIILTILLIIFIIVIDLTIKFSEKNKTIRKKESAKPQKNIIPEIEESGKILVPDSTYEILMKEKKKQK